MFRFLLTLLFVGQGSTSLAGWSTSMSLGMYQNTSKERQAFTRTEEDHTNTHQFGSFNYCYNFSWFCLGAKASQGTHKLTTKESDPSVSVTHNYSAYGLTLGLNRAGFLATGSYLVNSQRKTTIKQAGIDDLKDSFKANAAFSADFGYGLQLGKSMVRLGALVSYYSFSFSSEDTTLKKASYTIPSLAIWIGRD